MPNRKPLTYYELKLRGYVIYYWQDRRGYANYEACKVGKPPNPYAAPLISLPHDMVIMEVSSWTQATKYEVY